MEKKTGKIKGFFGEFKKFITRGNVLDMAVGVIIGGAFTAIVNGLSNFVLKPIINWLIMLMMGGEGSGGGLSSAVTYLNFSCHAHVVFCVVNTAFNTAGNTACGITFTVSHLKFSVL